MGCRIPLTGTDMRHHPGENFEKPFVSWLKTLCRASSAAAWVGCGVSRSLAGEPQHAVRGPHQRGQARTVRVRPSDAAHERRELAVLRGLRADAPLARVRAVAT